MEQSINNKYISPELFGYLEQGGLVITANQRLGRYLELHYSLNQQRRGLDTWRSPAIMPWSAWLDSLWEQLVLVSDQPNPGLLTAQQERQCWLGIVQNDPLGAELMQTSSLAQTAQQAWNLWRQWHVPDRLLQSSADAGTQRFMQWAGEFRDLCKRNHWLDNASLVQHLARQLEHLVCAIPRELRLAGFDEVTPDQQVLLEALEQQGIAINPVQQEPVESNQRKVCLADAREELQVAAQWARQQHEAGVQHVAVVVPDLGQRRHEVARIFDDVLVPPAVIPGTAIASRPYTISMGSSLADVPVIGTALVLCQSIQRTLVYDHVSAILHTPYIAGGEAERSGRVALDIRLRDYNIVSSNIFGLRSHLKKINDGENCPLFVAQLDAMIACVDKLPARQGASAWAQSFVEVLNNYGWPGRSLNSEEYQAYGQWDEVISELAGLDRFTERLSLAQAIGLLQRIAREKIFQVKAPPAPIQLLGALESTGMRFDALWICGLTDEAWPPAASPNALLPVSLQRQFGLPHSSAEREHAFIKTMHERLAGSADEVIYSWPAMDGDKELAPSPFIAGVECHDAEQVVTNNERIELSPYAQLVYRRSPGMEVLTDAANPLPTNVPVRGGTGLLRLQSACPFSAFASYRLNIRPLEEPAAGLDPRQRGSLVHSVMQAVWGNIQSHERLCAMNNLSTDLKPLVDQCVDAFMQQQPQQQPLRFVELEKTRLLQLVSDWLEGEKQRTPFTIAALEQRSTAMIGGLQLNTQIDRLDETLEGVIAIDYKTGDTSIRKWLGERPEEPQLPLYVEFDELMKDRRVAGVMFGCMKKGVAKQFDGIVVEGVEAPGAATVGKHRSIRKGEEQYASFDLIREHWQQVLNALAQSYMEGDAAVDPRDSGACTYCGMESLCRIHELDKRLEHNGRTAGEDA